MESLPCYTSSPPPFYSERVNEGEEVLAATRVYQTPTGSFTARCHCGDLVVTVKEQNEDIEIPLYHQRGLILGTFSHKDTENFLQVILKVEGKLKLSVFGKNSASVSIKLVDESYELWSKKRDGAKCPGAIDFATVLPSTFKEGNTEFPLPPSHKISLAGLPGLYSECALCTFFQCLALTFMVGSYAMKVSIFSIPFKYWPRERPSMPLISYTSVPPGCELFRQTIKTAPEVWVEKSSTLHTRPSLKLDPIEVQFFVPSERKFGLVDKIPFHVQLTGSESSLLKLYSHLLTEQSSSSSALPVRPRVFNPDSERFLSLNVTLNRQVCVDVRNQAVWRNFVIGEGRVHPLPPHFEPDRRTGYLDVVGDIKCSPEVEHGSFDVGRDFLLLQIAPVIPSDNAKSPFFPLKIAIPISLVSESWSETMII
ncbi:hypothetical protein F5877DRAFT_32829 [Lentinula edodes]|nr:hypothetical protein F5877DRAFT_32829 [Lentinula edodes]